MIVLIVLTIILVVNLVLHESIRRIVSVEKVYRNYRPDNDDNHIFPTPKRKERRYDIASAVPLRSVVTSFLNRYVPLSEEALQEEDLRSTQYYPQYSA